MPKTLVDGSRCSREKGCFKKVDNYVDVKSIITVVLVRGTRARRNRRDKKNVVLGSPVINFALRSFYAINYYKTIDRKRGKLSASVFVVPYATIRAPR